MTDVLREKLDDQEEQYSCRPCLVIEGIRSRENETESSLTNSVNIIKSDLQLSDVTINDVDNSNATGLDRQIMMVSKTS